MTRADPQRLVLDACLTNDAWLATLADDVRRGLTANQKFLPSKYFYDARGSGLFERITELPEYYQTRTESAVLRSIAQPLVAEFSFNELVEIGSGSATKTRTLLDAMERRGCLQRYVPVDVSEHMLRQSAAELLASYSTMRVHGVVGDFQCHLDQVPPPAGRRLVIFLGSTIGNLDVDERSVFLRNLRRLLQEGDAFLLGVDLVKDIAVLEAAYNDAAGVTAEFNRNILRVVNRELSANFQVEAFQHHAFYSTDYQRIEMHLVPESPQRVHLGHLDLMVSITPEETIHTEISCKFTRVGTEAMLEKAGLRMARWYTDPANLFGLALATPSR